MQTYEIGVYYTKVNGYNLPTRWKRRRHSDAVFCGIWDLYSLIRPDEERTNAQMCPKSALGACAYMNKQEGTN